MDPAAESVASVRAHLQTALGSIEAAVDGLGFTPGSHSHRERWRRMGTLLQQALDEIQAAKAVCDRDRSVPLALEPER